MLEILCPTGTYLDQKLMLQKPACITRDWYLMTQIKVAVEIRHPPKLNDLKTSLQGWVILDTLVTLRKKIYAKITLKKK